MGARGPVPKRSTQRHGHRKAEPVDAAPAGQPKGRPRRPAADKEWHPLARRWYLALGRSGQARWYEASDWEHAYVWAELLSRQLCSDRPSAMMLAAWDSAASRLLVTEGDRRRVRIELEQPGVTDPDKDAGVASMQAWRAKLAGGA
jgi:hypothetical protein